MSEDKKANWWQPAVAMFLRLSVWIAAPVIIGVAVGKWLDQKFQTAPWLFLSSVGLMFLLSMFGLIKETKQEFKKINQTVDQKNKPQ